MEDDKVQDHKSISDHGQATTTAENTVVSMKMTTRLEGSKKKRGQISYTPYMQYTCINKKIINTPKK